MVIKKQRLNRKKEPVPPKSENLEKFLQTQPQDTQVQVPLTDSEGNRGTATLSGNQMLGDIDNRQKALEDLLKAMG